MKSKSIFGQIQTMVIASAFVACSVFTAIAEEKVLFQSMKLGPTVVKNVRVSAATPVDVTILYDGGGSVLDRKKLPPELATLYPYDAKAAAEYEKKQEIERKEQREKDKRRQEENNRELRGYWLQQQATLKKQIEDVEKEMKRNEKERNMASKEARGRRPTSPQRKELDRLREEYRTLEKRQGELKSRVDEAQKQLLRYP
jgi:hypothetical protein